MPEFAQIKPWPSCELNGMVLVWYHCDGMDPTWQIPEQEEITLKKWIYRGRTEHFINSHIQVQPDKQEAASPSPRSSLTMHLSQPSLQSNHAPLPRFLSHRRSRRTLQTLHTCLTCTLRAS